MNAHDYITFQVAWTVVVAIQNGDVTGLTDDEIEAVNRFESNLPVARLSGFEVMDGVTFGYCEALRCFTDTVKIKVYVPA